MANKAIKGGTAAQDFCYPRDFPQNLITLLIRGPSLKKFLLNTQTHLCKEALSWFCPF